MPHIIPSLAVLALCSPSPDPLHQGSAHHLAQGSPQQDPWSDVQDVISRRCAPCHAPGAEDAKALKAWGLALDLAGTLEIEYMVEPGDPEASDLFLVVEEGDMPPADWEGGACTPSELSSLRAWIMAGAPLPPKASPAEPQQAAPGNIRGPWRTWFGRLHPAVVHFPIGLLIAAVIADLLRKKPAASFCLCVGAIGAVLASVLGWIAGEGVPSTKLEELDRHRWTGIAVAVYSVVMAFLYPRLTREDGSPGLLPRVLLVVLLILVSLAGHWGGEFTWGKGYLDLPW